MNEIPIIDLKKQYESIQTELDEALKRVFTKGIYILGDEVSAFESEFAKYCNASYGVGVASGTDALTLSLLSCDVKAGDEVIAPSHTAVATISAIEMTGAKPVLVDIDIQRYTLDPSQVEKAISKNTKAIIPVHLYGCPADLNPILEMARQKKIFVIEDCAQAHGAKYQGQRAGSHADIAAFSFYPTKNLGAFGDGGMIITNDSSLAEKAKLLRQYGWKNRYVSQIKGMNSRLDELHAAMLRVKLKYLDAWNARRRDVANLYLKLLSETELILPMQPQDCEHVFHQFVICHPKRDALKDFLYQKGIHTLIHYPVPVHLQPAYKNLGYAKGSLPNTEKVCDEILSLPLYPELTEEQVEFVCKCIIKF
ncbi:MAG TPA: erythromycin biosynthesis sensory transduction protein eryC1 [Anaerolineae bacterium]|nr:erythromycin biosynthesis sensory transduction protein eryC1 [Anaerolineae bacterium]